MSIEPLTLAAAPGGQPVPQALGAKGGRPIRVVYLFTTFPVLTETPAQRELRALRELPVEVEIHSIWGGNGEFDGRPIRRFNKWRLFGLLWRLPYWVARRPRTFAALVKRLARAPLPSGINAGETLLGIAFAVCSAGGFARADPRPDLIHAAWATLPATAAQLLSGLTGIPYSMGAHAYDVFRHGGDWDLAGKLGSAALIVTSSQSTRRRLLERGADPHKTVLVRRGLLDPPTPHATRRRRVPLHILAVGRLIEKKGYSEQLLVYAALKSAGIAFRARIVGAGPLERTLRRQLEALGLASLVTLTGALPYSAVLEQYAWADVLLFTGKVARDGDRDGLPNVIPEAMAAGLAVVAGPVAGVPEAMANGANGILITAPGTAPWVAALHRLQRDDRHIERLSTAARAWVDAHFDARRNTRLLFDRFQAAAASPRANGGNFPYPRPIPASQRGQ